MDHGVHRAKKHRSGQLIHIVDERNQQNEAELSAKARRRTKENAHWNGDSHQKQQARRGQKIHQSGKSHIEMHLRVLAGLTRIAGRPNPIHRQRLSMPRRYPVAD